MTIINTNTPTPHSPASEPKVMACKRPSISVDAVTKNPQAIEADKNEARQSDAGWRHAVQKRTESSKRKTRGKIAHMAIRPEPYPKPIVARIELSLRQLLCNGGPNLFDRNAENTVRFPRAARAHARSLRVRGLHNGVRDGPGTEALRGALMGRISP